jgi:lipoate-protein ligase A
MNKNNYWRLIRSGHNPGSYNMALDEALLEIYGAVQAQGETPPAILRFYGWNPACLSIGYAQKAEREVDFEGVQKLGVDWVRRPTGGRAILHESTELTYSLVASTEQSEVAGSVLESYRLISEALLSGLKFLNIEAENAGKENSKVHAATAACFDAPSAYEITIGGRKVIGSAQARRGNTLLQQGTILVEVDVVRLFTALKPPLKQSKEEAIEQVSARLTSLSEALSRPVGFSEAETAFIAGFSHTFNIELRESALTPQEAELAAKLTAEKYSGMEWNMTRQRPTPVFRETR